MEREKRLEQEDLGRQRAFEVQALVRERDARLHQLDRDIRHVETLFDNLSASLNQALLARGEDRLADVHLGSAALPPAEPVDRNVLVLAVLAGILGALTACLAALMFESTAGGTETG